MSLEEYDSDAYHAWLAQADGSDDDWRQGECDHCYGETVNGPLGPIHCACQIGLGAEEDDCECGPPPGEAGA